MAGGADADAADYKLQTPLFEAAMIGHIDVVKRLIQDKPNISGKEAGCRDPLSYVSLPVKHAFKELLQLLMKNDVCIDSVKDCDSRTTPMCDLDIVDMSVECGVDIHARNVDNLQAIDIASYCGHVDIVRYLCDLLTCHFRYDNISTSCLSSGTQTDCNSNIAVHLATFRSIRSLLENGADTEVENVNGLRPIHWAVRDGTCRVGCDVDSTRC